MKVLLDTNVVLDVLLDRKPHAEAAATLFALAEQSRIEACLCAVTLTTVEYLLARALPKGAARAALRRLIRIFDIAPVNRPVIESALDDRMADFEDAVLAWAGKEAGADCVITRNVKDFKGAPLKAFEPAEFLRLIKS